MKNYIYLILPLFISCSYEKTPVPPAQQPDAERINQVFTSLNQYPTGQNLLQKISSIKNQGFTVSVFLQKPAEMRALSESSTSEGYIQLSQSNYKVFVNADLDASTLAHIIAHELAHIVDDYQIDLVLKPRPDLDQIIGSTVQRLQAGEIQSLNPSDVTYVLDSLFCTEANAYTINQKLIQEGLANQNLSVITNQMAEHIDATYIQRYQTSFGGNKQAMLNWCLSFASATELQNYLITKFNN